MTIERIDYPAVVLQLQLENERLRAYMKDFSQIREVVYKVPNIVETLYNHVISNKYQLLIGVLLVYWCVSIALLIYDRLPSGGKL